MSNTKESNVMMMNKRTALRPIVAAVLAAGTTLAVAQTTPAGSATDRMPNATMQSGAMDMHGARPGRIIGKDVVNRQGEKVGEVEDLVVDHSGNIYAVVSTGTFLAVGERLNAVPWQALTSDRMGNRFVIDVDKQQLSRAPGFKKDKYPDVNDARWTAENRRHFRDADRTMGSESRTPEAYGTDVRKSQLKKDADSTTGRTRDSAPDKPYGTDVQKERMAPAEAPSATTGSAPAKPYKPYGTDVQKERMDQGRDANESKNRGTR